MVHYMGRKEWLWTAILKFLQPFFPRFDLRRKQTLLLLTSHSLNYSVKHPVCQAGSPLSVFLNPLVGWLKGSVRWSPSGCSWNTRFPAAPQGKQSKGAFHCARMVLWHKQTYRRLSIAKYSVTKCWMNKLSSCQYNTPTVCPNKFRCREREWLKMVKKHFNALKRIVYGKTFVFGEFLTPSFKY